MQTHVRKEDLLVYLEQFALNPFRMCWTKSKLRDLALVKMLNRM